MLPAVLYTRTVEVPEPDEAATLDELVETLLKISKITFADGHRALRSVHAKSHALLEGELTVMPGLSQELAQGIFATPATYPVALRFSSTPGDLLNDSVSTPRGLAMKIIGIPGARLEGSEGATTQDFLMVNGPAFLTANAKQFLRSLKLLASTTDKAPRLKSALSAALRGAERVLESVGAQSGALKGLGGEPPTHPLGESYFTQVPLKHGCYIAKLSLAPVTEALTALKGTSVPITESPNALREAMGQFFAAHQGIWELRAQLCRDFERMPVENASVLWPEEISPYLPVARLRVGPQTAWSEGRSRAIDDGIAFSPWHGTQDHRPLGSIMRARKVAYEASRQFRSEHSGCPMHEPVAALNLT